MSLSFSHVVTNDSISFLSSLNGIRYFYMTLFVNCLLMDIWVNFILAVMRNAILNMGLQMLH